MQPPSVTIPAPTPLPEAELIVSSLLVEATPIDAVVLPETNPAGSDVLDRPSSLEQDPSPSRPKLTTRVVVLFLAGVVLISTIVGLVVWATTRSTPPPKSSFAQELKYLNPPEQLWVQSAGTTVERNCLFLSPDGSAVIGTFSDGSVRSFVASTGVCGISYTPVSIVGSTLSGLGGLTFSNGGPYSYIVYAVADNATDPITAQTYVPPYLRKRTQILVLLTTTCDKRLRCQPRHLPIVVRRPSVRIGPLDGVPAGTPVTTSDGQYVLLTHNLDQTTGIFTVLRTNVSNGQINVLYEYVNETGPFSPIGFYHNPAYEYYDGGELNTNDVFIWTFDNAKNSPRLNPRQVFAFQIQWTRRGRVATSGLILGDGNGVICTCAAGQRCGMSLCCDY